MSPAPRLAGRLALVTGATRGIGRAVALAYAKEGAHLILVGRTAGALEEVDDEIRSLGGNATLLTLDLKNRDKIDALGPTIYQRWQKLDIVVGNAGILGPLSPLGHVTADAWDEVLNVNLTANWRLIRTLDPLLRRSDAGRAIFVSSGAAVSRAAYWGPYAVSKAGLEALVVTYAHEHARQGLSRGECRFAQDAGINYADVCETGRARLYRQRQDFRSQDRRCALKRGAALQSTSTTMPS